MIFPAIIKTKGMNISNKGFTADKCLGSGHKNVAEKAVSKILVSNAINIEVAMISSVVSFFVRRNEQSINI